MIGNILVVDDDIGVRDLVVCYLNTRGYQTSSALSGEEALTRLDQNGLFDLVITDFKMPGMNGLELARKSLVADPDRPVSGYTTLSSNHSNWLISERLCAEP